MDTSKGIAPTCGPYKNPQDKYAQQKYDKKLYSALGGGESSGTN